MMFARQASLFELASRSFRCACSPSPSHASRRASSAGWACSCRCWSQTWVLFYDHLSMVAAKQACGRKVLLSSSCLRCHGVPDGEERRQQTSSIQPSAKGSLIKTLTHWTTWRCGCRLHVGAPRLGGRRACQPVQGPCTSRQAAAAASPHACCCCRCCCRSASRVSCWCCSCRSL